MAPANDAAHLDDDVHNGSAPAARRPLGEMMIEAGLIDERQLADALDEGARTGLRLGEVVVGHGWASEEDVGRLLAEQWGLSYVDRASIWFDADALGRLSREDAQRLEALPTRIEQGRVVVAVAEPTEHQIDELRRVIGEDPVLIVVPRTALEAGLHSDLLRSRGGGDGGGSRRPEPQVEREPELEGGDEPDFGVEIDIDAELAELAEVVEHPSLTALPTPLPEELVEEDRVSTDVGGFESVAALAAQAQGVADLLAAQAAAMRDEAATYSRRIEQLEAQLAARDEALAALAAREQAMGEVAAEVKRHLEAAVRALEAHP
jgi:hypothetical protein